MIAEYERAQILERSRRGKRHRAHSGEVSVMSGAPYGYRYIRKTDEAPLRQGLGMWLAPRYSRFAMPMVPTSSATYTQGPIRIGLATYP